MNWILVNPDKPKEKYKIFRFYHCPRCEIGWYIFNGSEKQGYCSCKRKLKLKRGHDMKVSRI